MNEKDLLLDIAQKCFNFINPSLNNYFDFSSKLATQIKVKELENIQYSFDIEIDNLIKNELKNLKAKVFSEESGWFETAQNYDYKIIYDPFCNSSLASRSFREAAMGISIFTNSNIWLASLILDYQTGLVGLAQANSITRFYQVQTLSEVSISQPAQKKLSDSWTVITLESQKERANMQQYLPLLSKVGRLIVSSGHTYWLKLAMGVVDSYLDPVVGEELYEMFAATVAEAAGCKVTDKDGVDFNASEMLNNFESDRHYSYYPVAATSSELHTEILSYLQGPTL